MGLGRAKGGNNEVELVPWFPVQLLGEVGVGLQVGP